MRTLLLPTWIRGPILILFVGLAQVVLAQSGSNRSPVPAQDGTVKPVFAPPPDLSSNGPAAAFRDSDSDGKRQSSESRLSPWASEVVKLAQAGIEDGVVLSFIDNIPGTFNLGADQIIRLRGAGVSSQAITAMIEHDVEMASGLRPVTSSTVPTSNAAFQITFVSGNAAQDKAGPEPSTVPAASDGLMNGGLALSPREKSESEPGSGAAWEDPKADWIVRDGPASGEQQSRGLEKRVVYPVREPYPVELTAPIVVIRGWGRVPNTLVIEISP